MNKMHKNEKKAIALVISLFVVVVLLGYNVVNYTRVIGEARLAQNSNNSQQAFYEAEAGRALTQSGIYAFLGGEADLGIRAFRVNLTTDRLEKGHTEVKVIVCSDNAGDKVPDQELVRIYKESGGDNKKIAAGLNNLMRHRDQDDGCLAISDIVIG